MPEQTPIIANRYLTETELSKLIKRSVKSLQRDRAQGGGIPFVKMGAKILYDTQDVEATLAARKFSSTSEYAGV